jgi:hypothetical protein
LGRDEARKNGYPLPGLFDIGPADGLEVRLSEQTGAQRLLVKRERPPHALQVFDDRPFGEDIADVDYLPLIRRCVEEFAEEGVAR